MRPLSIVLALTAALPTAASAQFFNPALTQTPVTTAEITRSYQGSSAASRAQVLASLDAVCSSKERSDQRRCSAAWKIIDQAYADLKAKRAQSSAD